MRGFGFRAQGAIGEISRQECFLWPSCSFSEGFSFRKRNRGYGERKVRQRNTAFMSSVSPLGCSFPLPSPLQSSNGVWVERQVTV